MVEVCREDLATEMAHCLWVVEGALLLKSLDCSKALSDVIPLPEAPHMVIIEHH